MNQATQLDMKQLIAMQKQVAGQSVRRKFVSSAMSGAHLSRLRGRGMEFDEVRVYQPGDDVGTIDWKVTARKGKTHVKLYREERERPVLICLDYRKSMFFATRGCLKSVQATNAAALLAWHGVQHGDRLGGLLFSDAEHFEIKPKRGRMGVLQFLHRCSEADVWKQKQQVSSHTHSLQEMTRRLRKVSKPGSLIYILSDFRGLDEASIADLSQIARHNDVVLISVFDELERSFPDSGAYPVFDGQDYFMVHGGEKMQQAMQQHYATHEQQLEMLCRRHGIHQVSLATHDDALTVLRQQLWTR